MTRSSSIRQAVVPFLLTLLASSILALLSAYVQIVRLEERLAAQEKRIDYFHGQPTRGER
jgi:hypothetical protein